MKFYRTLVRIVAVRHDGRTLVCVPSWNPHFDFFLRDHHCPPFIIEAGQRLHADVNLDEDSKDKLIFKDWEDK